MKSFSNRRALHNHMRWERSKAIKEKNCASVGPSAPVVPPPVSAPPVVVSSAATASVATVVPSLAVVAENGQLPVVSDTPRRELAQPSSVLSVASSPPAALPLRDSDVPVAGERSVPDLTVIPSAFVAPSGPLPPPPVVAETVLAGTGGCEEKEEEIAQE